MLSARVSFVWAAVAVGCAGAPNFGADPTPEEKWARGLAEDYWGRCGRTRASKGEQAAALLSPELAQSLVMREHLLWGDLKSN